MRSSFLPILTQGLLWLLIAGHPVIIFLALFYPGVLARYNLVVDGLPQSLNLLPPSQWFGVAAYTVLETLSLLAVFYLMLRLIEHFRHQEGLGPASLIVFYWLSRALLAVFILGLLHEPAISLLETIHNPPGERVLTLAFEYDDLIRLTLTMFAYLFYGVARHAVAKQCELDEFV